SVHNRTIGGGGDPPRPLDACPIFFFFQAEDGIRDRNVTGVQTCAVPILGAGAAEGAIDAANILKPVLARGELQMIGATTNQEFRSHIQKDPALERRFGRVQIDEPTPEQARGILEGLAPRYERYHGVLIPPEALDDAVELSVRYLPGRCLPDKAIDLMDEACAAARIRAEKEGRSAPALTREDMARVVARASGIPAERVGEAERERLALLE